MSISQHQSLQALLRAVAAGLLSSLILFGGKSQAYDLVTADDYAERSPVGSTRAVTTAPSEGPEIIVHAPDIDGALRSPLDFDIEFRANGAEPVMGSLILEYDLGLFWKDITDRLAGHAEISDNRIVSRGAELPAGEHHLRLSISDLAGKTTTSTMILSIAD